MTRTPKSVGTRKGPRVFPARQHVSGTTGLSRQHLWFTSALVIVFVVGCTQRVTYEIDFSQAAEFEWDGKLRVTKATTYRIGPLLTLQEDWRVERIEMPSCDGRVASVDPEGYCGIPVATLGIDAPMDLEILGTRRIFRSHGAVMIMDAESAQQLAEVAQETDSETQAHSESALLSRQMVRHDMRPYVQNIEKLTLLDWWAIALEEADHVALDFIVPHENLRIIMQGDPRQYGPAVLEIRTQDGRLVRRFEQEQVPVQRVDPEEQ